jgi:hypothetical protein
MEEFSYFLCFSYEIFSVLYEIPAFQRGYYSFFMDSIIQLSIITTCRNNIVRKYVFLFKIWQKLATARMLEHEL